MASTIRNLWFNDHVARVYHMEDRFQNTVEPKAPIQVLDWRKPGTGLYGVRYILDGNKLSVTGDLGCAAYVWGQKLTFEYIAMMDMHYFHEKCEASEKGRTFAGWNEDVARFNVQQIAKDIHESNGLEEGEDSPLSGIDLSSEAECMMWLNQSRPDCLENDAELLSAIIESGTVINARCIAHWLGIKMAMERKAA